MHVCYRHKNPFQKYIFHQVFLPVHAECCDRRRTRHNQRTNSHSKKQKTNSDFIFVLSHCYTKYKITYTFQLLCQKTAALFNYINASHHHYLFSKHLLFQYKIMYSKCNITQGSQTQFHKITCRQAHKLGPPAPHDWQVPCKKQQQSGFQSTKCNNKILQILLYKSVKGCVLVMTQ